MVVPFFALLLLSSGCASTSAAAGTSNTGDFKNSVTVSGEGKLYAPSDEASLTFAVHTVRNTATRAMSNNSTAMSNVINALHSRGLTDDEVKTGNISLYPQQDWHEGRAPKIISYTAENRVIVRTKKLDKLGGIIDAGTNAGATEVSELRFQLSEDSKVRQDALKSAVRNARAKAEALAKEAGVGIGKAIIISEGLQPGQPIPYGNDLLMRGLPENAKAMAPPVMPQDILVTANVSVSFEMN
ncbi:MAG: SIMPL domain-containing protein [Candidatus Aquicultor sp.]